MPEYFLVYPAYLGRTGSRSVGRRIPVAAAPHEVTIDEIVAAAHALGYEAEPEPEKQYPRQFHTYAGRVKVKKKSGVSKSRFLKEIALEIRRRGAKGKGE